MPVVAAVAPSGIDSIAPDDPRPDIPPPDVWFADSPDPELEEPDVDMLPLDAGVLLEGLMTEGVPVWAGVPASEQWQSRKMPQEPNSANRIGSLISTRDLTTRRRRPAKDVVDGRGLG